MTQQLEQQPPDRQPTQEDLAARMLVVLSELLNSPQTPTAPPDDLAAYPAFQRMYRFAQDFRAFLLALAEGDLSQQLPHEGYVATELKALQTNLRHLTWQTQMIAAGDFTQRVDFMGEFAEAFNVMVARLAEARTELTDRNAELQHEILERQRLAAAEREQRLLAEALQQTGQTLVSSLEFTQVLDRIPELMRAVIGFDCGCVLLVDGDLAFVARLAGSGRVSASPQPLTVTEHAFLQACCESPGARSWEGPATAESIGLTRVGPIKSWLGAALHGHDQVLGFLVVGTQAPDAYTEAHAQRLSAFAAQTALAIQNARLFQVVQQMAIIDSLTGIYNRRHFFNCATQEILRAGRYHFPYSSVMIDIDHFKRVNDTYGHQAGDAVIQHIAQRCLNQLRSFDILARYGGEEFVLLLPQTDQSGAWQVAERLRSRVADAPIRFGEMDIPVTISVGTSSTVSTAFPNAENAEHVLIELVDEADRALYASKQAGRNRVTQWQEVELEVR